ncbi:MAG: alanine racemase, partial [Synergistes sp.]|nr:alanine racemase [Synergistes sp.]
RAAPIHIAVDTGMSRIGFREPEKFAAILKEIAALPNLTIEGIFTHFARADEDRTEPIINQAALFKDFLRAAEEAGIDVPIRHCSNSAASLRHWDEDSDAVRLGISLYGVYPSDETKKDAPALCPAMELKSRIVHLKTVEPGTPVGYGGTFVTERKTRIATIPVGYADGYPRGLSNKGSVIIRGRRAKIIGRICMDQFMADITDIPEVSPFDEATLLGRGGDDFISVEELSELSGRFPYEFLCCIGKRVPRVYKND